VLVAAVWTRDGRKARWAHGLTADEAGMRDPEWRGKGLVPLDVAGYAADGEARYALLWGPKEAGMEDTGMYVGQAADQHQAAWEPLRTKGFVPRTQTQVTVGGEPRYSAVWWKPTRTLEIKEYNGSCTEAEYESALSPSNLQTDLRLAWSPDRADDVRKLTAAALMVAPGHGPAGVPWAALVRGHEAAESGPPGPDFAAVWIDSAERVSEERHGQEPAAQTRECGRAVEAERPGPVRPVRQRLGVDAGPGVPVPLAGA
jgi:hypothetical protein